MEQNKAYIDSFSKIWHKLFKLSYGNTDIAKFKEMKRYLLLK